MIVLRLEKAADYLKLEVENFITLQFHYLLKFMLLCKLKNIVKLKE